MAHILIVEDEESLANALSLNLTIEGHQAIVAATPAEARSFLVDASNSCDLALLDVMLPGMSGFDLAEDIRGIRPALPFIFLTASGQPADKVRGLKLGADDYIVKPFDLEELLLRITNALRRSTPQMPGSVRFGNGCSIDFGTFEVTDVRGQRQTLSRREIGLLRLLSSNAGKVISRDEIIEALWGPDDNASSRTIDNYILSFRKLFESSPRDPRHFHSVRGVGYRFTLAPSEP